MADNERIRILNMVKDGAITIEEAERLLAALDSRSGAPAQDIVALKDTRGRKPKKLRITVDSSEQKDGGKGNAKVNVNIPISLVKSLGPIAMSGIPKDTRKELEANGIDIAEIIRQVTELIDSGMEEDIVNIDAGEGEGTAKVRVYVE